MQRIASLFLFPFVDGVSGVEPVPELFPADDPVRKGTDVLTTTAAQRLPYHDYDIWIEAFGERPEQCIHAGTFSIGRNTDEGAIPAGMAPSFCVREKSGRLRRFPSQWSAQLKKC